MEGESTKNDGERMKARLEDLKKVHEWIESKPFTEFKYTIERLEYYVEELFKYAQFKAGDEVKICKEMEINENKASGWLAYKERLQVGCCGIVLEADHYKGKFRYAIRMDPQKEDEGCFTIQEEFLKSKNWDKNEN